MIKTKLILLTASLFLFSGMITSTFAQSPVSFGLKGGVNLANLNGDNFSDADVRSGLNIGVVLEFSLPLSPIGIESGLYYSQKGASNEDLGVTSTLKTDYLEVPVLAKLSFGPPGPIKPHLLAGPYLGFLLNSEAVEESGGASSTIDFKDSTNDVDFGLTGGIGLDVNMGLATLSLQARYSLGLTEVYTNSEAKHGVFAIVAGFTF
jgi:hypothetical protein